MRQLVWIVYRCVDCQRVVTRPEWGVKYSSTSSFRDGPKDQTRNLEIPGSPFGRPGMTVPFNYTS
jgi:hypothetical protein